jgi:Flp pilus assembly pilin Flp
MSKPTASAGSQLCRKALPTDPTMANRHDNPRGGEISMLNSFYDFVTMLVVRLRHEEGQTMAEYGILLGVIALVVVVVAVTLGSSISALFSSASTKL